MTLEEATNHFRHQLHKANDPDSDWLRDKDDPAASKHERYKLTTNEAIALGQQIGEYLRAAGAASDGDTSPVYLPPLNLSDIMAKGKKHYENSKLQIVPTDLEPVSLTIRQRLSCFVMFCL